MAIRIQDLYTFHLVARTGAMKDAAGELGVTPGAISQRIRNLEERHGRRLFTRSKNGIALTAAGRALQADIGTSFLAIEAAHDRHFTQHGPVIRVSACASFAHSRLVSSLGRFGDLHPAIRLSVETDDRLVDLRSEPVDLAIRHGLGKYPGLISQWLCSPKLVVVASPTLLEKHGPLTRPADCLRYKLLPDATGQDWSLWFNAQGVDATQASYGTQYGSDFLMIKAAIEAQGLALVSDAYVKESLASGQLTCALNTHWPRAFAYYAVATADSFERPAIKTFVEWLRQDLQR